MWWVGRYSWLGYFRFPGQTAVAIAVVLLGVLLGVLAIHAFRVADTTVEPLHPEKTSALVVRGVYRRTRNPMYLGLALILLGWGLYLGSLASLLGVPAFILLIRYLQIEPEEAALESKFGEAYREYCSRIHRWI